MGDLDELRRRRDELDSRIKRAEEAEAELHENRLMDIEWAVKEFAEESNGIELQESERKSVKKLHLVSEEDAVDVYVRYASPPRVAHGSVVVTVWTAAWEADLSGAPKPHQVLALVRAALNPKGGRP